MQTEIWKDIKWYKWLYQVSNLWNIKGLKYTNQYWSFYREKLIKQKTKTNWYKEVCLNKWNINKMFYVHRLVLSTFIKNIKSKSQVNHINWIKNDNRVENLEWVTVSENQLHRYKTLWYKNKIAKKIDQYDLQWNFIKTWGSMAEIWKNFFVTYHSISNVCRGLSKTSKWYIWNYHNSKLDEIKNILAKK